MRIKGFLVKRIKGLGEFRTLERFDLVVVGAGPAGSMAAYRGSKLGLKVLLLEEHKQAGSPPHCAGKLSVKAFKEFSLPSSCILNRVRGALLHSPGGLKIQVSKPEPESYIIDRELLDARLTREALNAGAQICFQCKVKQVSLHGSEGLSVEGEGFEARASMLVIAEGGLRKITLDLGFPKLPILRGIQAEVEASTLEREDFVEVFLDWRFFPGFFGWIIPVRKGEARVGLCVHQNLAKLSPRAYLEKALKSHPILSRKAGGVEVKRVYGGLIPIEGPVRMWHPKGVMLAGDAAGHAKSTTGGGVFFGLKAGWLAGEAAAKMVETGNKIEGLKGYEQACLQSFGRELTFTRKMRRILNRLGNEDLDRLFRLILSSPELLEAVERHGDTAYQSRLWKPMLQAAFKTSLKNPASLKLMLNLLWKLLF